MSVAIYKKELTMTDPLQDMDWLDDSEKQRAARFVSDEVCQKYVASHAFLRSVLSKQLNIAPAEVRYVYGDHGKPSLVGKTLYFNLSHSADMALVVVSRDGPVGIDVELKKPLSDFIAIAQRFFSKEEVEGLLAEPASEQLDVFYRLWTRKEAYLKMLGLGLSFGLDRFTVSSQEEGFTCLKTTQVKSKIGRQCWLGSVDVGKNYSAAVAVSQTTSLSISIHERSS